MAKITVVFEEDAVWHSKQYSDMSAEEQEIAAKEWREAEEPALLVPRNPPKAKSPAACSLKRTRTFKAG